MKWRKGRFPLLRLPLAVASIAVLTGGLAVGGRASDLLTSPFTSASNSLQSASNIASAPFRSASNSLTSASPGLGGGQAGGLDPNVDSDGDGILNGDELRLGTDPLDVDTDDDGIWDGRELQWLLNPLSADTDNDGIQDGTEIGLTCEMVMQAMSNVKPGIKGTDFNKFQPDLDPTCTTNPRNADSDGGGVVDGLEDCNGNGRVDNMDDPGYNQTLAVNRTQPMGACFVEMPAAPQRGPGLLGSSGNLAASPWNTSATVSGSPSASAQQSVNSTVGSLPVSGAPSASVSTSPSAVSQSAVTLPSNSLASTSASPFNASQGASGSLKTLKTQNISGSLSQSITSPSQLASQSLTSPLQSASQSLTSPSASASPGPTAQPTPTTGVAHQGRLERNPCDRSDDGDTTRACPPGAITGIVPPGEIACPEGQLYNPATGECVAAPAAGAPIACGAGTELQDTNGDGVMDTCVPTEAGASGAPGAPTAPQIACGPGTTQVDNACVPVACPEGFTLLPGHPLAGAANQQNPEVPVGCVDFWADADHDGIPDVWEAEHGIHSPDGNLEAGKKHANQDPDHDGCSNLTEFIMGTDPQNGSDGLCLDYWRPYPPF